LTRQQVLVGYAIVKKSALESLVEQPIAATDSSQNTLPAALDPSASFYGLCHGKKSELESLAEQSIAATNSATKIPCQRLLTHQQVLLGHAMVKIRAGIFS
jgi:hypothetical protein